jgi:hypothetical protein
MTDVTQHLSFHVALELSKEPRQADVQDARHGERRALRGHVHADGCALPDNANLVYSRLKVPTSPSLRVRWLRRFGKAHFKPI